ncbi:MAG TPA: translation initiation factor eIF-1A [Euryarchaeota archaeon]|nr:translation initiation factor eIF-1A [Euryarchaeota archaeon]
MGFDNTSEENVRSPLPDRKALQMFGIAETLLGAGKIRVVCEDGKSRLGRIPGKIRKRMWIREGDLLIVVPWEHGGDDKCDIKYRYTRTQAINLARKRVLPEILDVF